LKGILDLKYLEEKERFTRELIEKKEVRERRKTRNSNVKFLIFILDRICSTRIKCSCKIKNSIR